MQPQFVTGSPLLETAWAVGILVVSGLVAWLILFIMRFIKGKLQKRFKSDLFSKLIDSVSRPVYLLIIIEGLILALNSVSYLEDWSDALIRASIAVAIAFVTFGLARVVGVLLVWYLSRARVRQSLIRLIQRVVLMIICIIGVLILLDYYNISISPLLAGLGLGGLAIALALQPTLSNFFAGAQIVSDHVVRIGDYIELDGGSIRGFVTEVGWRSTRIRTPYNNLVIIPNSRLADTILTNFYSPTTELGVIVYCGVSYNSDLLEVERIAMEVTRQVIEDLDGAIKTFEPWFRYEEFGDSNINFWIWLQAKDRLESFNVKSELIKRLKARFDQEGITINYPARLLTFESPDVPQSLFPPYVPDTGSPEEIR